MLLRMRATISGTRGDGTRWPPRGETIDLPLDEAAALLRTGMATAADPEPDAVETRPAPSRGVETRPAPPARPARKRKPKPRAAAS